MKEFQLLKLYSKNHTIYTTEFPHKSRQSSSIISSEDLLTRIERMKTAGILKKEIVFSIIFLVFCNMISEISINFAGEQLTLNQYRSIFWDKEKSLILSDLHLGKTAHFRKNGIALP